MTSLQLPKPLEQYFAAANSGDLKAQIGCFTPDARVRDEGHWLQGREALTELARESREKYNSTASPRAVEQSPGEQPVVVAEVKGNFPGSPIDLRFHFTLESGAISALEIKP